MMSITDVNNLMASITNIVWNDTNPAVDAVVSHTLACSLHADVGAIPFGNKKVWKSLQLQDLDCKLTIDMITSGNIPPKKSKNKIVSRLLRDCCVNKQGILVSRSFDSKILKEVKKIVIPQQFLHSVLTILHNKLMHPSNHQMAAIFNKYFFAPNLSKAIEAIKDGCDTPVSIAKLLKNFHLMKPNAVPSHPGST